MPPTDGNNERAPADQRMKKPRRSSAALSLGQEVQSTILLHSREQVCTNGPWTIIGMNSKKEAILSLVTQHIHCGLSS